MAEGIFEASFSILTILFAATLGIFVYKRNKAWDYWRKRGVVGPEATFPFGNLADVFLGRKPMCEKLEELYRWDEEAPVIGFFASTQPVLLVKDPDFVKTVLVKDFEVFDGRGIEINEDIDPLSVHLFNVDGARWRVLRQKLTPVFTSGKLRSMFQLMAICADNFEHCLKKQVEITGGHDVIECREIAARYTTDVIGCCAFGIDTHAIQNENSVFRQIGRQIFQPSVLASLKNFVGQILPRVYTLLRVRTISPEITEFFIDTIRETIELRKSQNFPRNDFIDLLIQITKNSDADAFEWTIELMAAQAFVFFGAGFETSSTTIGFALWELARTPQVQERLREEILEWDARTDGIVSYDIANSMKYLDMVVKETLRKNPPATVLVRRSNREYTFPGTEITIEANQPIKIPVYALHRDRKYYPNPEVFDPERFTDEAKSSRHPMLFLPFGDGPKNCIGLRFAYYQVKLALVKILKNFRISLPSDAPNTYEIDPNGVVLSPIGGIRLKFELLQNST